jgi:ATP-dependent RNA circularization protein (DNA/RNA ligase family)
MAERYKLDTVLPPGFAIQGEICGPGIQKNRLGLAELDLFVFSVCDTRTGCFLDHARFIAFCAEHGLRTVPVEHVVTGEAARTFDHGLEHYLKLAGGFYAGTRSRKEGIVVRPLVERHSPTLGGRLSFKIINNEFLLKDED